MCIISERVSFTLLALFAPPTQVCPAGQLLEPLVTSALSKWRSDAKDPPLSALRCGAAPQDGVIMNKK